MNHENAVIAGSLPGEGVILKGQAVTVGGVAGVNRGLITGSSAAAGSSSGVMTVPGINMDFDKLAVGGVAGQNQGKIENITVQNADFTDFSAFRYLGGITGRNLEGASVNSCGFVRGTIQEGPGGSAAGNCYGGIAGENAGQLSNCQVTGLQVTVQGVYTATATNSAQQKEAASTHVGGIAGKNETTGLISGCVIGSDGAGTDIRVSRMMIQNGMAGGVAGYNKGKIELSGDPDTGSLMIAGADRIHSVEKLVELAGGRGIKADVDYIYWSGGSNLDNYQYSDAGKRTVTEGRTLLLTVGTNGNLGGITAYNSPEGHVDYCSTGNWYLANKSEALGVGTGGIIGMNESENDLSFLLNRAFVGRQLSTGATDRFAGGIIGNQNTTTRSGWKFLGCVNYGTVYCLNAHYSGGILGQWTGTGGTIEKCRNYGNLQTTLAGNWNGASGGIVAQLYHAYEENEYNIISCENYGNIYGRSGKSADSCANDSAGILGNVTAYGNDNTAGSSGQGFTIQVIDCVNGSGVNIYSSSMASGIIGFFSCDEPTKNGGNNTVPRIRTATENIKLRIERCRNFAENLKGNNFISGIFGERYGKKAAENTVLQDCVSVRLAGTGNYPLVSYINGLNASNGEKEDQANNNNNTPNVRYINASGNYFLEGNAGNEYAFCLEQNGGLIQSPAGDSSQVKAHKIYYLDKGNEGKYFVCLRAEKSGSTVKKGSLNIDADGVTVYTISGKQRTDVGFVLFKIVDGKTYQNMNGVVGLGSTFDTNVRTAWYRQETGAAQGSLTKMPPLQSVGLTVGAANKLDIHVVPADGTDPFRYEARLYLKSGDGSETLLRDNIVFYSEKYSIGLTSSDLAQAGMLVLKVRACSMYAEIQPSDFRSSAEVDGDKALLPEPQLRIELVKDAFGGTAGFSYKFHLENQEDYKDFTDYLIRVRFLDGSRDLEMTVGADGTIQDVSRTVSADSLQQLLVQAVPVAGNDQIRASGQVSLPVYLPGAASGYRPSIRLGGGGGSATAVPGWSISGNSLRDLKLSVTLDASGSGIVTTPPVYRAELIGTWKEGADSITAVLAQADMLTASNGISTTVFSNLPEYITRAEDLRVRVWYAQSGLGPVYTSHSLTGPADANLYVLKEVTEEGVGIWEYGYSLALDNDGPADCSWMSGKLWDWLPRPHLSGEGQSLTPVFSGDNRLQYVFSWDQEPGEYTAGQEYIISLTGIRGEDRVTIVTDKVVNTNQYTADAENWTYDSVELTVTRRGNASGNQIGLSATGKYQAGQRLPRPAQLTVTNDDPNRNELNYTFQWAPISPEKGCASYEVWLQPYQADGVTLDTARKIGEAPVGSQTENGLYSIVLDLKDYKGQKVVFYLIAKAGGDPAYVDSTVGVTSEVTVPNQIRKPVINQWRKNWVYDRTNPVAAESFEHSYGAQTGLSVEIEPSTAQDTYSIPPGDSSYLVKAYIFDSLINAQKGKGALEAGGIPGGEGSMEGLLTVYSTWGEGGIVEPAVMDVNVNNVYSHLLQNLSMEYAGKYILFYVRISSGNGMVGSPWTANDEIWQLPFVKLPTPAASVTDQSRDMTATIQLNPDLPGTDEIWKANNIVLAWNSVEPADSAYLTLTAKDGTERNYRIVETTQDDTKSVTLYRYQDGTVSAGDAIPAAWIQAGVASWRKGPDGVWVWNGGTNEDGSAMSGSRAVFRMWDYGFTVKGSYTEAGLTTLYTVKTEAVLEVSTGGTDGFGYTLILPDADSVSPKDGILLTGGDLLHTAAVRLKADVTENAPDAGSFSDAYVESASYEATFGAAAGP